MVSTSGQCYEVENHLKEVALYILLATKVQQSGRLILIMAAV